MLLNIDNNDYPLCLKVKQLLDLQKLCNVAIAELATRVGVGKWQVEDISNILEMGLRGGGLTDKKAKELCDTYLESTPFMNAAEAAANLLAAALVGNSAEDTYRKTSNKKK